MIKEIIEVTKLTASDGMILTNGTNFARVAFIGTGDSPDNWHEITEAEYKALTAEPEIEG